jgi:putative copper resistance protein D
MGSGGAGAIHLGADLLHLWTAGIWFGALAPLGLLILRARSSRLPDDAAAARYGLERFSRIGTAVVAALVLTGVINSAFLIGASNWRSLFAPGYGAVLLLKLGLFALMMMLAAGNRFWLTPKLRHALGEGRSTAAAVQTLSISLCLEIGLAVLLLATVGLLGTLPPPVSGE